MLNNNYQTAEITKEGLLKTVEIEADINNIEIAVINRYHRKRTLTLAIKHDILHGKHEKVTVYDANGHAIFTASDDQDSRYFGNSFDGQWDISSIVEAFITFITT